LDLIQERIKKARQRAEERKAERLREGKVKSMRSNVANEELVLPELSHKRINIQPLNDQNKSKMTRMSKEIESQRFNMN
jgi:hypothetical protein